MTVPTSSATYSTSEEAFQNPLPTVRQFHKQLQLALDEKNVRLRTLVGGSYRQLLGTAEMIVDMRQDIGTVENRLARVAEGCGRSAVGKRVAGLGKLGVARDIDIPGKVDLGWLARMKVLDGCVIVVGRLLRGKNLSGLEHEQSKGKMLVATAKVLVLSRLLVKSLGDDVKARDIGVHEADGIVEEMKKKLGALRRRLLRSVERVLAEIEGEKEDLIRALCAYSLATSSGAKDVLRHFLHVRGEAMALAFENEDDTLHKGGKEESILRTLGLYTCTLIDAQALVPRRLSEALLRLKGKPLLKDDTIRVLEGLRLDVSERWFGDEIMFFTPYIRHDDLDGSQAIEMLSSWGRKASQVLLQGFEKNLRRITEIKTVVELRTKMLELWILEGGKVKGFDSSIMLDELRKVLNNQMVYLLEARIAKLHLVGTEIEAVLNSRKFGPTKVQNTLWNEDLLEIELTGGAAEFKQAIMSGMHGRNNSISRVVKGYETWRHLIDDLILHIDQLKSQRWDGNIDSLEDDEILENRSILLSKDDPQMLQDHMDMSLEQAYKELDQKIFTLLASHKESDHTGGASVLVLRILRDIRADLPKRPDLTSFALSMVPVLQSTLASSVSSEPINSFTRSLSKRKAVVGRALWEGSPELPVQPSPLIFKFLYSLTSSMANAGADLWSPAAVSVIKEHVSTVLGKEWSEALKALSADKSAQSNEHTTGDEVESTESEKNSPESAHINGEIATSQPDETKLHDVLIQSLFDVMTLKHSLDSSKGENSKDSLVSLHHTLESRIGLDGASAKRLQRAAQEYWKRTNLLFGLLA